MNIKSIGKYFIAKDDNKQLIRTIKRKKYKVICINDAYKLNDFEKSKNEINLALNYILPNKSKFEI